jgi:hypothetical protein
VGVGQSRSTSTLMWASSSASTPSSAVRGRRRGKLPRKNGHREKATIARKMEVFGVQ